VVLGEVDLVAVRATLALNRTTPWMWFPASDPNNAERGRNGRFRCHLSVTGSFSGA
jgi:hypothetical protein